MPEEEEEAEESCTQTARADSFLRRVCRHSPKKNSQHIVGVQRMYIRALNCQDLFLLRFLFLFMTILCLRASRDSADLGLPYFFLFHIFNFLNLYLIPTRHSADLGCNTFYVYFCLKSVSDH